MIVLTFRLCLRGLLQLLTLHQLLDNELVANGISLVYYLLDLGVGRELEIAAWHLDGLVDEGFLDGAELINHH